VIALLDYGAGNLTSVRKALSAAGADHFIPAAAREIDTASAIVIPGVGHFGATQAIAAEWRDAIRASVDRGVPLLGICLGMQYLFDASEEAPALAGLGLIAGTCRRLSSQVKVPHVGWNDLIVTRSSRLLAEMPADAQAYFTHSYAAPVTGATVATVAHGDTFAAAVERDNVFGVQFHPEKSSAVGLRILRTFVGITRSSAATPPDANAVQAPDRLSRRS
jgi:glutamine amidotransferase